MQIHFTQAAQCIWSKLLRPLPLGNSILLFCGSLYLADFLSWLLFLCPKRKQLTYLSALQESHHPLLP